MEENGGLRTRRKISRGMPEHLFTRARVRLGGSLSRSFSIPTGLREGCVLSPLFFFIFIMDLAEELERKGFGITVKGRWLGACFFPDDIVLLARSGEELQEMLDVVGDWGEVEDKV